MARNLPSTTCFLWFITLSKASIHFVRWMGVMFLRPANNLKIYGSWAIVTGSTDGIVKAISMKLASKGLNILLVGRNPKKLEATSKEIRDRHGEHVEVKLVGIDFEKVNGEVIVKKMEEATESLDVGMLVNNASMANPYPRFFHEEDFEFIEAIIKVNVETITCVTKEEIKGTKRKKKGAIINIGSASSAVLPSFPLCPLYAATEAYFEVFSKGIGLEYKSQGIDVQCQRLCVKQGKVFYGEVKRINEPFTDWENGGKKMLRNEQRKDESLTTDLGLYMMHGRT